ncbi:mechanosensitive ion channel domain-containing protein [Singulisphaera acidiphila]|uniref:Small-conductance mechanosensitive channel n=1 Tax=Singulisphaera acidiphila (strain ATCC BAA-1392 / DSM 18658 / VKM B-2454 / MOB10) TaxID=886293 RepID=L0DPV4_SINAD|nr:mechanosensitive ion channel domain-containing protein [Singulisphaera acidiphila]AGA30721.1 small-conductance mechanosensitive channel [Singulisphaera acidiphila DSM 18658]
MRATWAGCLAVAFGVLWIQGPTRGGEPAPTMPVPPATATPPLPPRVELDPELVEAAKVLTETKERLDKLGKLSEKEAPSSTKALKVVLEDRIALLTAIEEAAKALDEAKNPKKTPESLAAEWKADLERLTTQLKQSAGQPDDLLPSVFRKSTGKVASNAILSEMNEAIDGVRSDLKKWQSRLDKFQSNAARKSAHPLTALQAERDAIQQRVAALPPRQAEREAELADSKTEDERLLATERLVNIGWETRVENERLQAQEAKITLQSKLTDLEVLDQQVCDAHARKAAKTLELMQARFKLLTDRQEDQLKREAASEQALAAKSVDPLERYKSRGKATLLELEAQALKYEKALAASSTPSLEEQTSLANRAITDFENIKRLLDDDLISQLDALRLNNDFRRIGPQRARIESGDLKQAAWWSTHYDNALTSVELDQFNDRRNDEYEHETLLEQIPRSRWPEAKVIFAEHDRQHELLLARNRAVLEKLARRAEQTHAQVVRRLRTLDDQYGFIRTHIFWLRDQEPIGLATLVQAKRETFLVGKSLIRLAQEAGDRRLWGRISVEFVTGLLGLLILVLPLLRLRKRLLRMSGETHRTGAGIVVWRGLLVSIAYSAILPSYICLMAYTARQAAWPRSVAVPIAHVLAMLAPPAFIAGLVRWMLRPRGWAEETLKVPADVTRQLCTTVFALVAAGVPLLLPSWLLSEGWLTPEGRAISSGSLGQILGLVFELIVWGVVFRLARGQSPLMQWLLQFPTRLGWLNKRRRTVCWSVLAAIGGVIVLDAAGYSHSARRLALGAGQGLVVLGICFCVYRMILTAIDHHAWRWIRVGNAQIGIEVPNDSTMPDDLAYRLRQITAYLIPVLALMLAAWIWDVDWALFRFIGSQPLWNIDTATPPVRVGDFAKFALILVLTLAIWKHMSTLFALVVFPRMRDDPGVRFAVVTLCRYIVLGIGLLSGLSAIHLGLEKIGVVLAALGVGLGFGLQEIVSNFVCGIILLLERPIRVGDIVTVSGMTGKVEFINIRATTITNGENLSIIVPNRAFITSDLVNWTLKDKVIRVSIRMKVAHGTDPDRVADLLLNIAREDADVLRNPVPVAFMEDFSDSALNFVLHVHVPEPSLGARVRHRLFAQIQRRFTTEGIEIPLPRHELRVHSGFDSSGRISLTPIEFPRVDSPSRTPPGPKLSAQPAPPTAVEACNRGVDE